MEDVQGSMESVPLMLLAFVLATVAAQSSALQFQVINNASGTPGGARFDRAIGIDYAKNTLAKASSFIWSTFGQRAEGDRKNIAQITLILERELDGAAAVAFDGEIHANADYIAGVVGDVRREFAGVVYHETTHLWQWNGRGTAPGGLIEGIADYVRLEAGLVPGYWVKPGEGERWDQGYDVTARFLEYCVALAEGSNFVAGLNARLKDDAYSDGIFLELLGKTVDQLWHDYKEHFHAN